MIKEIRRILQSGECLSDFSDKCKNDGACRKCEDEALEKLIAEHDAKVRTEVIDECLDIIDKVMPLPPLNKKHYENWKMKTTELRMVRSMLEQLKEQNK